MIVKVQLSMPDRKRCMIYDQGRKNVWEDKTPANLLKVMSYNPYFPNEVCWKAFFNASLDKTKHGGLKFNLGAHAKWQEW